LAKAFWRIIGHPYFLSARKRGWAVLAIKGKWASVVIAFAMFFRKMVTE
jgi:hypothetical protein